MDKPPRKKRNYIDDNKFWQVMNEYIQDCNEAESKGEELPRIPEFVGECFLLLAKNVCNKYNFYGYQFREDMMGDAVINCCKYIRNFKPWFRDKKTGELRKAKPFAYFTQYIHNSFIFRIKEEKKKLYTRYKTYEHFQITEQLAGQTSALPESHNEIINNYISTFEEGMEAEKERKKAARSKLNEDVICQFYHDDEDE
jgi:hypothetical protein